MMKQKTNKKTLNVVYLSTRNTPLTPQKAHPPPAPPALNPPLHISNSNQQINKQIKHAVE